MVEMDVKISANDLYDYMLKHAYSGAQGLLGSCVGALLIVAAVMTGRWPYMIFGVILLLYLPCTFFLKSRQQIAMNPSFQQPLHYLLNEEGLMVSQGEDSAFFGWEDMVKAVSTNNSIILYTSAVNATIFPKKQLGDKLTMVIEVIATHMPPAKVKIRC